LFEGKKEVSQTGAKTQLKITSEGCTGEAAAVDLGMTALRARAAARLRLLLLKRRYLAKAWDQTDSNDPGKVFAPEVLQKVHARMPWAEPNGARTPAAAHRI
jgi:hypothetical protein